jgi:hypothetical protein
MGRRYQGERHIDRLSGGLEWVKVSSDTITHVPSCTAKHCLPHLEGTGHRQSQPARYDQRISI